MVQVCEGIFSRAWRSNDLKCALSGADVRGSPVCALSEVFAFNFPLSFAFLLPFNLLEELLEYPFFPSL